MNYEWIVAFCTQGLINDNTNKKKAKKLGIALLLKLYHMISPTASGVVHWLGATGNTEFESTSCSHSGFSEVLRDTAE